MQTEGHEEQCVDVVLSDMCEPWDLIEGRHKRSISNPYYRMMNTSGNAFQGSCWVNGMLADHFPELL